MTSSRGSKIPPPPPAPTMVIFGQFIDSSWLGLPYKDVVEAGYGTKEPKFKSPDLSLHCEWGFFLLIMSFPSLVQGVSSLLKL